MKRIEPSRKREIASHREHFEEAAFEARRATCLRAKCGSVVVSSSGIILGRGFNAPPLGDESQRTCQAQWDLEKKPKYDKTCCVHAEWNAVLDTVSNASSEQIEGSRLYFMRVDETTGDWTDAGEPYCTTCSRLTMESGIAEFALWNNGGIDIYELPEYNELSYNFYATNGQNDSLVR